MRAFVLPPLPSADADAAANDRFDLRLTRARLAVVRHGVTQSPSTPRNVTALSAAVTLRNSGFAQCNKN